MMVLMAKQYIVNCFYNALKTVLFYTEYRQFPSIIQLRVLNRIMV